MEIKASLKNLNVPPRKARLVVDTVRGLPVETAIHSLAFTPKKVAGPLKVLLESAVANAGERQGVDVDALYVKRIWVGEGRTLKRFRPRSRGMAVAKYRRSCHIDVVLDEK